MTACLLDSDAVIDYLANVQSTVNFVRALHQRGDVLCTCSIVLAEVYSGLLPGDRPRAAPLLKSFVYLVTDAVAAEQAGDWRFAYRRQGVSLATTDTLIAATALAHGAQIITGNVRHYPMPGVAIVPLPRVR